MVMLTSSKFLLPAPDEMRTLTVPGVLPISSSPVALSIEQPSAGPTIENTLVALEGTTSHVTWTLLRGHEPLFGLGADASILAGDAAALLNAEGPVYGSST